MTEKGESLKIIIDARGTERTVSKPVENSQTNQPSQISEAEKTADFIGKSVARALEDREPGRVIDTPKLAQEIAKAQGLLSPEQYLEDYRDAEDFLKAPFQIVPGAEPRFWPLLNEKEKQEWMIISTLVIAAYKKSVATGTDKLYMDEMRELAVDLNKRALKVLFGSRNKEGNIERPEYEGVDGVLPATSIYCTIIGDKRFYSLPDEETSFYDLKGNPTEVNLKTVLCKKLSKDEENGLTNDFGNEIGGYEDPDGVRHKGVIEKDLDDLRKTCPDSIYPHDREWGTPVNQESFRKLRESVRLWLVVRGRDLLLTTEERLHRKEFYEGKFLENSAIKPDDKDDLGIDFDAPELRDRTEEEKGRLREFLIRQRVYRLLKDRARDAEQISWNFVYSTSVLEHFDSRDYRPAGTKRHGPSYFWGLFQWTPMHLQERLEQKVARSVKEGERESKEEWSALGSWALHSFNNGWWKREEVEKQYVKRKDGKPILVGNGNKTVEKKKIPAERLGVQVLPDTLFRDALHSQSFHTVSDRQENGKTVYETGLGKKDENKENNGDTSFFSIFNKIGNDVLSDPRNVTREDLETRIDWSEKSDSPFVPFIYDEMRWADVVQQVFKKGAESRIGLADLGEAVRNLRLPSSIRKRLLMVYFGIDSNSRTLRPKESQISWRLRLAAIKEYFPNFFLEK